MIDDNLDITFRLLETGTLAEFRVVDTQTELSPDGENIHVRAELAFEPVDEDDEPSDVVEWAAFGFGYALAALSFRRCKAAGALGSRLRG